MRVFIEYLCGNFSPVNEPRFFKPVLFFLCIIFKLFVEEAPTADGFRHMHIYNTPRCQDCFLVGILEVTENFGYLNYSSRRSFFIRGSGEFTNAFSGSNKNISVVVFCKVRKNLLCHALRHEFFPGFIVNKINKAVNVDIFIDRNIRAVDHQRHADRNTAKNVNCFFAGLFCLFLFQAFCNFFRSWRRLWIGAIRAVGIVDMFNLFICQALTVYNNLAFFLGCLRSADNIPEFIELRSVNIVQLQQFIVIYRFIFKAAVNCTFGIDLLDLLHHGLHAVFFRAGSCDCNNRTVIQKFRHCFAALLLIFARFTRQVNRLGKNLQRSVRSKIEYKAICFLFAVDTACGLNAEDGLHILGRSRRIRSGKHKNGCPFFYSNAGCQLTAGKRDGKLVLPDGVADKVKCIG